ncbi:hypothetical protein M0804_010809 [Polistes exclamans]|nr:hypothetical protein M0804_010809 [Polistes exclamans]
MAAAPTPTPAAVAAETARKRISRSKRGTKRKGKKEGTSRVIVVVVVVALVVVVVVVVVVDGKTLENKRRLAKCRSTDNRDEGVFGELYSWIHGFRIRRRANGRYQSIRTFLSRRRKAQSAGTAVRIAKKSSKVAGAAATATTTAIATAAAFRKERWKKFVY